jgi:hypothetical protein
MKPFHTIAVPHNDIIEGKLTMDVFAADLWETYKKRAPSEYRDTELFFTKTFITSGLKNLLDVVEKRLKGQGGDPVIQIQTPFGGGKTHSLIALYHSATKWNVNTVVIVGTALDPRVETLWGLLEEQLDGIKGRMAGNISPGRDALRELLTKHQPVLVLMDEILEYITKASGVPVGETSLAAQTLAFMQELTEVAGTLEKACIVVTLPSSLLENYDEKAERLLNQIQKVSGRVERIYTPVQENEISRVVRRRLFSSIDKVEAKRLITSFIKYAEKEGILPGGVEASDYRDRFIESYPFIPEVIEVLYHKWGSYPTFQRTRGVLRLLSLLIYSLKESGIPYVTLSDFDLANQDIRQELIKHIGAEFNSVIAADITDLDSGSKKVDASLGKSYRGLHIGTRAATSIFLYSFSGAQEKGAHIGEIKRNAIIIESPSSIVAEAVGQLKSRLFYLQSQDGKYYFLNQPNLNRIIVTKMENIRDEDVRESEREILRTQISGKNFKVFIWPDKPKDITDTPEMKLVILPIKDVGFMKNILETKGDSPRVYRNTIIFLSPSDIEKNTFLNTIRRRLAYEQIQSDKTMKLTENQLREISKNIQKVEEDNGDASKRCYRLSYVPVKDGLKEIDLGIPTYGEKKGLDEWVYEVLRAEQEILEKISPKLIQQKYLENKDFVNVQLIYDSMLKTQGERRLVSRDSFKESILQGVKEGLFGLGEMDEDGISARCKYFKTDVIVMPDENEVIIKDSICNTQKEPVGDRPPGPSDLGRENVQGKVVLVEQTTRGRNGVTLKIEVPQGKVSQILGMIHYLQSKFEKIELTISAKEGSITEEEYENKINETLRQLGIDRDED